MKNNQFAAVLAGLLAVSTLITFFHVLRYVTSVKKLQALQPRLISVNSSRTVIQSLINDTQEYSRKNPNPDIQRLWQQVDPQGTMHPVSSTPAPAAKPTSK